MQSVMRVLLVALRSSFSGLNCLYLEINVGLQKMLLKMSSVYRLKKLQ